MAIERPMLTAEEAVGQALAALRIVKGKVELPYVQVAGSNVLAIPVTVKAYAVTAKQIRIDLIEE